MIKAPIRQCIVCRKREPKQNLFRIVFDSTASKLSIDEDKKSRVRSFYVHQLVGCCSKVPDVSRIAKALRIHPADVTKESVTSLFKVLLEKSF
jgi:predicted RNA-binding protein YlxR (DUF448 family)